MNLETFEDAPAPATPTGERSVGCDERVPVQRAATRSVVWADDDDDAETHSKVKPQNASCCAFPGFLLLYFGQIYMSVVWKGGKLGKG